MAYKKKSNIEKLHDSKDFPRVEKITPKLAGRWGTEVGDTVVIPAPLDVDRIMRSVPKGKLITVNQIREKVAKENHATIGCPITCGIFASIAAHAAEEERAAGQKDVTPWWRTLKSDGSLSEKYPGDIMMQKAFLEKEGHKVVQKGKKYFVVDFDKSLTKL